MNGGAAVEPELQILPVAGLGEVHPGDDLSQMLGDAIAGSPSGLLDGDVLVLCQKVVSKAEGRVVELSEVEVSDEAAAFASRFDKDAALVELAMREAVEILRMQDGHLITATAKGFVAANSGIDRSNQAEAGQVTLLPLDSDASARALRERLQSRFKVECALLISDTFGRPWRMGQVDVAIGAAGLEVLDDFQGREDWKGRPLEHTLIAVADQLCAAAGLLMGKAAGVPAVLIRGFAYQRSAGSDASQLLRPRENDLFR